MRFEHSLALCMRGSFQKHTLHLGVDGRTKSHPGITVILIFNFNISKGFNKTCWAALCCSQRKGKSNRDRLQISQRLYTPRKRALGTISQHRASPGDSGERQWNPRRMMGVSLKLWMKPGIVIRQVTVINHLWPHHKLLHYFRSFIRVTCSLGNLSLTLFLLPSFPPFLSLFLHPSFLLLIPFSTLPFSHKCVISIQATNGWNTWVPPNRPSCLPASPGEQNIWVILHLCPEPFPMAMHCLGSWRLLSLQQLFLIGRNIWKPTLGPKCLPLPTKCLSLPSGAYSTLRIRSHEIMQPWRRYDHLFQYVKKLKLKEFKSLVCGEITRKWEFRLKLGNDRLWARGSPHHAMWLL